MLPQTTRCFMKRLFFLPLFLFAFASARGAELNVFAAASLSDALREIAKSYQTLSGDRILFNFGGSSTLALQIKNGAPADLFFSADEAKMNDLAREGLIASDTRRSLLSNTLVIVVSTERPVPMASSADLTKPSVRRIALGEPQIVPAGVYAKQYLQKIELWSKLSDKVVPTENVRACLAAVEAGNVEAGIVYKTDALISKKVSIAYEVPMKEGPKISYPVAVLNDSKQPAAARKFATFLGSEEARAVFTRFGFLVAP